MNAIMDTTGPSSFAGIQQKIDNDVEKAAQLAEVQDPKETADLFKESLKNISAFGLSEGNLKVFRRIGKYCSLLPTLFRS